VEYIVNYEVEPAETETCFPGAINVEEVFWIYEEDPLSGTKSQDVTTLIHAIAPDLFKRFEEELA
jgi:hypothetical protein